nr:serine hydrolase [Paracoccus methylarcula]
MDANLGQADIPGELRAAIETTHGGRTQTDHFTQAMIWERYPWPADHAQLLAGSDSSMVLESQPAQILETAVTERRGVMLGKTGATNGFSGYVALVPEHDLGIVVLANRNYPLNARVDTSLSLIEQLLDLETSPATETTK